MACSFFDSCYFKFSAQTLQHVYQNKKNKLEIVIVIIISVIIVDFPSFVSIFLEFQLEFNELGDMYMLPHDIRKFKENINTVQNKNRASKYK